MPLTSKITPYNPDWPERFESSKSLIASAFDDQLIDIHHVGSTAVPGLAAKPEIDILIEVQGHVNASAPDAVLMNLGYARGSDLSDGHHFYRRNVGETRTHKLHICTSGHVSITQMLVFRDLLRHSPELRQRYEALKLQLEASNKNGMAEYLTKKAPFIIGALLQAGICASE
nr:GrpB family protein [uncultured Pseudomonas sp.]